MDTYEFLERVVTTESGQFVLCSRNHSIQWQQEWYLWPDDKPKILERINFLRNDYDLYFSSHLFSEQCADKNKVLETRTIQADLDNAELNTITLEPSVLVETSPKRYQAYWILHKDVTIPQEELELLSKRVTYSISNADHTGWPLGHRLRIPGSLNFKYTSGPHTVTIVNSSDKVYLPEELELVPILQPSMLAIHDTDFAGLAESVELEQGPFELINSIKSKLPQAIYLDYISKNVSTDRSASLWALMCALFEAGVSREQVFWLAKHSANNKFAIDLKYHADRELAKDVLRAEQRVKVKPVDVRSIIDSVRIMKTPDVPGGPLFKRRNVLETLRQTMALSGRFLKVAAGLPYFIPNDTGRPIALTTGSEHLRALLHLRYGINSADPEYKYVHTGMVDYGVSIEQEIMEGSLSFYDSTQNTLFFHTGRKEVLKITGDGITVVANGDNNILFPWYEMLEPFSPNLANPYRERDWGDVVFGDLHNTTNMEPREAKALLKVWFMFTLFRSSVSTRPILALFGPPQAGKSTIPHNIYALLYARRLKVQGASNPQEFDTSSIKQPVYAIDNLDTYIGWILDKLAQAIGDIDILKRKLYTDIDVIRMRRQAMLVVTAHNPKFTREDITSRLLLINLARIEDQILANETDFFSEVLLNRDRLWGAILKDAVKVLNTSRPNAPTVKWRIQDFASLGEWIAIALNIQDDFNNGLRALLGSQSDTLLQQEEVLVTALTKFIETSPKLNHALSAQELWNELLTRSDQKAFTAAYKNAIRLSHKLMTMKSTLQNVADIESSIDISTRTTLWTINAKQENETNTD